MRCFVTGGCGFLGGHAVRHLVGQGSEIAVLAMPGESQQRIADLSDRIEIVEADLADRDAIAVFLRAWRAEACLHCAWYAEPGLYLESAKNLVCLNDSLALLEALIDSGCQSAVMVGTCAEYDTDAGFLREDGPVRPTTLYAAAKLATGIVARRRAAQAGMHLAWARMFYLFGPGENDRRMVPALIRALLAGREFPATAGEQIRDYLYVRDAAAGLATLLAARASGVFNVASGEPVAVRHLMKLVGEELGRSDLIRFGALSCRDWDPPFVCGDSTRLRSLGWRPRYDLREALRRTIEYWRAESTGEQVTER